MLSRPTAVAQGEPPGEQPARSEQLLRVRILHHDFGRVGQMQHRAGTFVQRVRVQLAGAEAGDPPFPAVAFGAGGGVIGAMIDPLAGPDRAVHRYAAPVVWRAR